MRKVPESAICSPLAPLSAELIRAFFGAVVVVVVIVGTFSIILAYILAEPDKREARLLRDEVWRLRLELEGKK